MTRTYLTFEKPIQELEEKIEQFKLNFTGDEEELNKELDKFNKKMEKTITNAFSNLSPWQVVQIARHPQRPYTSDYIEMIVDDFFELHGDRNYRDDPSIIGGLGKIGDEKFIIIGHEKGRGTRQKIFRNFGMAHPEGYRKAIRLMKLGEKFNLPILTLIDTPGAYPGIGAEERGQAEAIACNLREMSLLKVPTISCVIGEGGSGGALGIGVTDIILMLQFSVYSVISPEGCASILFRDASRAKESATALKLTAIDLKKLNIIDDILPEPLGCAHSDPHGAAKQVKESVLKYLKELKALSVNELLDKRYQKFKNIGVYKA